MSEWNNAMMNEVDKAIVGRKSVRAFSNTPVDKALIEHILKVASRAPSGNNTQPWSVYVLTGAPLKKLTDLLVAEAEKLRDGKVKPTHYEYDYYPDKWVEPYISRRRKVGLELYEKLGIAKDDLNGRAKQFEENYRFFGAPVGIFIFVDRQMGRGSTLDTGMFIQNILIGAKAHGLDTCAQAAFSAYHQHIYQALSIPSSAMLLCGIALGYANSEHPANQLNTERVAVQDFTTFAGFEGEGAARKSAMEGNLPKPRLLIDCGNTNIKWGVHDGKAWVKHSSLPISDLSALVDDGPLQVAMRSTKCAWVANVSGEVTTNKLKLWAKENRCDIHFITPKAEGYGIINDYEDPLQLGADRFANVVGAWQLMHTQQMEVRLANMAIISCGTAITIDYLRHDGRFLGGLILPGIGLMRQALNTGTAQLSRYTHWADGIGSHEDSEAIAKPYPKNSADAIATGVLRGITGAIEKTLYIWANSPENHDKGALQILITGGDANLIAKQISPDTSFTMKIIPDLVLEGLLAIAQH